MISEKVRESHGKPWNFIYCLGLQGDKSGKIWGNSQVVLQKVKGSRDELGHTHLKLIDFVGTFNLHTVHGVFKAGSEESG